MNACEDDIMLRNAAFGPKNLLAFSGWVWPLGRVERCALAGVIRSTAFDVGVSLIDDIVDSGQPVGVVVARGECAGCNGLVAAYGGISRDIGSAIQ